MTRSATLVCAAAWIHALAFGATPADKPQPVPAGASMPAWPPITTPALDTTIPSVRSGDLEVVHSKSAAGGFVVRVKERSMAVGSAPSLIGYVKAGEMHWLNCATATIQNQKISGNHNQLAVSFECADPDGGIWGVERRFQPGSIPGTIEVQTDIRVNQDRAVAFLPMLLLFPGVGGFGEAKGQGLFAGLEYLENEPSSSEADVIGPASRRQVPDSLKITFPLMVVQQADRYVGLSWQMRPSFSALFDSPDRLFHSGVHVMGLLFPGSDGQNRREGDLLPRLTELVHGVQTVSLRATILAGLGQSVVPAVQQFTRLRPLPPVPETAGLADYVSQAAGGWLDSKIREGNLVRHAIAGGAFKPQPTADAALWMEWLADHDRDTARATRLLQTVTNVLAEVPPESLDSAGVGHVRYPVESLVFGHVSENAEHAERAAQALLVGFEPDGSVKYQAKPGGPDYARTNPSREASGLASRRVLDLLGAASFCGKGELIDAGLERLRALDKFNNGVPRGAQTWECPLHTPDILASAQMVRAYTLGYELSGDNHFLEQARYWAWTGVPFIYLVSPTDQPVGLYATIPVFGATQWKAPVWLGLPVQWCGLVYADALYRLLTDDPKGPWRKIADGITASGIQQSWPQTNAAFQGLLPDSFVLREQKRNGPAINPATVEACAAQLFDPILVYDFHAFRLNGLLAHAPGRIEKAEESKGHIRFRVRTWLRHPYSILINGFRTKPTVAINDQPATLSPTHEFSAKDGWLVLQLEGNPVIDVQL